ncbi:efflux RND transporter permease subunit [Patescibacteria group bacterium]
MAPQKKKLSQNSYLGQLSFSPQSKSSLAGLFLKNIRLSLILVSAIILLGSISFFSIPRTLNPEVKIPLVVVSTVLPGAGPREIESLVTIPLEEKIKNIKGLLKYSSSSNDNLSLITAEFGSQIDPQTARDEVQAAIDKVTGLPSDTLPSQVQALDFENIPVIIFALRNTYNPTDLASLHRLGQSLKETLEEVELVDQVQTNGYSLEEIEIKVKPQAILEKGFNPLLVLETIKKVLKDYPAGKVATLENNFNLTINRPLESITDLRQLSITLQGQNYQLEELATIVKKAPPNTSLAYLASRQFTTQPAIIFSIYKNSGARIDQAGKNVKEALGSFTNQHQDQFEIIPVYDYSDLIKKQFLDLGKNVSQTLLLVFLSMFLLYGIKQSLIASLAIPVSLLVVFIFMQLFQISLNFVSIYSLLIALALFVDNAVVVIEAYTSYYKTGRFTPLQTAILVWKDFFVEVFLINLLTVWAFLPLLVTSGLIGEFVYPIPIIVSVAMIGSAAIAFIFTLPSMMVLTEPTFPKRVRTLFRLIFWLGLGGAVITLVPKNVFFIPVILGISFSLTMTLTFKREILAKIKDCCPGKLYSKAIRFFKKAFLQGFISLEPLSQKYKQVLQNLLPNPSARRKTILVIVIFTIFGYLLLPLGLVKNEFFPKSDQEFYYLQLKMPSGTRREITEEKLLKIAEEIVKIPEVDFVVLETARKANLGFDFSSPGDNLGLATIRLISEGQRARTSIQIAQETRELFKNYQTGKIQVLEESGGPPAGADLEIRLLGKELAVIEEYARQVESFISQLPGTENITLSAQGGTSQITFIPDPTKTAYYQISEAEIGFWLRTFVSGLKIDEAEFSNQDYDLVLRFNSGPPSPESLNQLVLPTGKGPVSLEALGKFQLKANPTLISRQNGRRVITISASSLPGFLPAEQNQLLEKFVREEMKLPTGYNWETGGANEENQESIQSILQAMILSGILILGTMVVQLGSFRKAIIVILVIPIAASAVLIIFALTRTPISFPALIGILALFGIVIANSLMIVDKVNQNLKAKLEFMPALIDAASSRLEPILLTTASQIIGLIPITLSDPLWQGMGYAIIAGMSVSGALMLFFIPIVYFYFFPEKVVK